MLCAMHAAHSPLRLPLPPRSLPCRIPCRPRHSFMRLFAPASCVPAPLAPQWPVASCTSCSACVPCVFLPPAPPSVSLPRFPNFPAALAWTDIPWPRATLPLLSPLRGRCAAPLPRPLAAVHDRHRFWHPGPPVPCLQSPPAPPDHARPQTPLRVAPSTTTLLPFPQGALNISFVIRSSFRLPATVFEILNVGCEFCHLLDPPP